MTPYRDRDGASGIKAFDVGADWIDVEFKDGATYRYTYRSAGRGKVLAMVRLARAGDGLNTFINQHVQKGYARRLK